MADNRGPDISVERTDRADDQCQIGFFNGAISKLRRQVSMGRICFGYHDTTAGSQVQAVDNAGPLDATDAAQAVLAMIEECVDQCARGMPRSGVHHQVGGFVDHQ